MNRDNKDLLFLLSIFVAKYLVEYFHNRTIDLCLGCFWDDITIAEGKFFSSEFPVFLELH